MRTVLVGGLLSLVLIWPSQSHAALNTRTDARPLLDIGDTHIAQMEKPNSAPAATKIKSKKKLKPENVGRTGIGTVPSSRRDPSIPPVPNEEQSRPRPGR